MTPAGTRICFRHGVELTLVDGRLRCLTCIPLSLHERDPDRFGPDDLPVCHFEAGTLRCTNDPCHNPNHRNRGRKNP